MRPQDLWNRAAIILGTGFGIGFVPVMPGTFGSLLGIPLAWLIGRSGWPVEIELAVETIAILAGIPICGQAARRFGKSDPGSVVYDEIAALPLVFLSVPLTFSTAIAGFIWFRIFDIAKPWPVRRLERLPGGLGIMADDVMAALYAAVALWVSVWLWKGIQRG